MQKFVVFVAFLLGPVSAYQCHATPLLQVYEQVLDPQGVYDDSASSIIELTNAVGAPDGYLITGQTSAASGSGSDGYALRVDLNGLPLWIRRFGGSQDDQIVSAVQLHTATGQPDGFAFVGGTNGRPAMGPTTYRSDGWIARLANDGSLVWQQTIVRPWTAFCHSIIQTVDRSLVATCSGQGNSLDGFPIVSRFELSGALRWGRDLYSVGVTEYMSKSIELADQTLTLVGSTASTSLFPINYNIKVRRINFLGADMWQQSYSWSQLDNGVDIVPTSSGGYAVIATHGNFSTIGQAFSIFSLDSLGNQLNRTEINIPLSRVTPKTMRRLADGSIVVVGAYGQSGSPTDALILKFDANLAFSWARVYGGQNDDSFSSVQPLADGGLVAVGNSRSILGLPSQAVVLLGLNSVGNF